MPYARRQGFRPRVLRLKSWERTCPDMALALIAALIVVLCVLGYAGAPGWTWGVAAGVTLAAATAAGRLAAGSGAALIDLTAAVTLLLSLPALRRRLVSDRVLRVFRGIMPPMSETEAEAINAGTVWWDGELFSGSPNWSRLRGFPTPELSAEEQSFLDRECEELCGMVSEWQ